MKPLYGTTCMFTKDHVSVAGLVTVAPCCLIVFVVFLCIIFCKFLLIWDYIFFIRIGLRVYHLPIMSGRMPYTKKD